MLDGDKKNHDNYTKFLYCSK